MPCVAGGGRGSALSVHLTTFTVMLYGKGWRQHVISSRTGESTCIDARRLQRLLSTRADVCLLQSLGQLLTWAFGETGHICSQQWDGTRANCGRRASDTMELPAINFPRSGPLGLSTVLPQPLHTHTHLLPRCLPSLKTLSFKTTSSYRRLQLLCTPTQQLDAASELARTARTSRTKIRRRLTAGSVSRYVYTQHTIA
jgi:hypothetical protein